MGDSVKGSKSLHFNAEVVCMERKKCSIWVRWPDGVQKQKKTEVTTTPSKPSFFRRYALCFCSKSNVGQDSILQWAEAERQSSQEDRDLLAFNSHTCLLSTLTKLVAPRPFSESNCEEAAFFQAYRTLSCLLNFPHPFQFVASRDVSACLSGLWRGLHNLLASTSRPDPSTRVGLTRIIVLATANIRFMSPVQPRR